METTNVKTKIAERLSNASETIANLTINKIADGIIEERTSLVCRAIKTLETLEKNLSNLVPDLITYNVANVKSESFSENRYNQRADISKKISELQTATDLALKENTESSYLSLHETICKSDLGFNPDRVSVRVREY